MDAVNVGLKIRVYNLHLLLAACSVLDPELHISTDRRWDRKAPAKEARHARCPWLLLLISLSKFQERPSIHGTHAAWQQHGRGASNRCTADYDLGEWGLRRMYAAIIQLIQHTSNEVGRGEPIRQLKGVHDDD